MRIFSKFQDYYDNIGYFSSEDRIWERKTAFCGIPISDKYYYVHRGTKIFNNQNLFLSEDNVKILQSAFKERPLIHVRHKNNPREFISSRHNGFRDYTIIIGFCGKLYCAFVLHKPNENPLDQNNINGTYLSIEKYSTEFNKYKYKGEYLVAEKKSYFSDGEEFTEDGLELWNQKYQTFKGIDDIFNELNTPIFIITTRQEPFYKNSEFVENINNHSCLIINPCMDNYRLQRSFDPFTTHQEIDMYLNNVLVKRDNHNIVRTNELIRDSKGMDNWSFKQCGPKERKRK